MTTKRKPVLPALLNLVQWGEAGLGAKDARAELRAVEAFTRAALDLISDAPERGDEWSRVYRTRDRLLRATGRKAP